MARPLPPNTTPPRNGSHGSAANLALAAAGDDERLAGPADWDEEAAPPADASAPDDAGLRQRLADAERLLAELKTEAEQVLLEQQTEFERILEEKSEIIRDLHRKVQDLQERPVAAVPANTPREEELMTLSEELERERRQLKDDEESLMQQMGQMEVQMSRERAELARQRTELQRLQSEIRHELELAARDSALRERLAPLQRRQQELSARRAPAALPPPAAPPTQGDAPPPDPRAASSGLFRRIFG